MRFLQEVLSSDYKAGNIRLREGEHQYILAKSIASFLLELYFPDVKDIIKRVFGEENANDVRFVRKIQTILKKMEKSNVVKILPKRKPWELQRYGLSSFRFQDADKNLVVFATDDEIKQMQYLLQSMLNKQDKSATAQINFNVKISLLAFLVGVSYMATLWALTQSIINATVFVPAFFIAVICSLLLGKVLSQK